MCDNDKYTIRRSKILLITRWEAFLDFQLNSQALIAFSQLSRIQFE